MVTSNSTRLSNEQSILVQHLSCNYLPIMYDVQEYVF